MTLIPVPRPPKSAFDPGRPVSALLKSQIEYLRAAESRLPLRYRSEIYVNAIKTEGEAASYIRAVTEAIHDAHEDAAARRARPVIKRRHGLEIAAVADERAERKRASGAKDENREKKTGKKKSPGKKTRRKPARDK
jgi:hypothetical protein